MRQSISSESLFCDFSLNNYLRCVPDVSRHTHDIQYVYHNIGIAATQERIRI
jgi:hypothetical protein